MFRTILKSEGFEVLEAEDGIDAIAVVNRSRPTIVILDVSLRGLDGITVCQRLKGDEATASIPIIMMSDRPSRETVVGAVKAGAADFVVKTGVSVAKLLAKVTKLVGEQSTGTATVSESDSTPEAATPTPKREVNKAWVEKKIDQLIAAKALPFLASEVLAVTADGGSSVRDLVDVVERDQGVTARILKLANSSYFVGEGRTTTVAQAIGKLGFKGIREMVLGMSLVENLGESGGGHLDRFAFWRHSLAVGTLTDLLAEHVNLEFAEYCMVAGILHDLGRAVADDLFREQYGDIVANAAESDCFLRVSENRVLGLDHALIGGRVARNWRLPDSIVGSIVYHHEPWEEVKHLPSKYLPRLVTIVKFADIIVRASDIGSSGEFLMEALPDQVCRELHVNSEVLCGLMDALKERLRSLEQVFILHEGPMNEAPAPNADGARLLLLARDGEIDTVELLLKSWNFDVARVASLPEDVVTTPPAVLVMEGRGLSPDPSVVNALLSGEGHPKVIELAKESSGDAPCPEGVGRLSLPLHRQKMLEALDMLPAR